ncbi:MAG: hypothetical protein HWN65_02520 [Candidatus Helarchaeota archaeon]|nr:hypothetical protein [Candidatus Helarchaeota archaeon]
MSRDRPINLMGTSSLSRLTIWYEELEKAKPQLLTEFDRRIYERIVDLLGVKP